eukprot:CAMPEP_0183307884 /NCGR_PEP_ID=MMETSP0160_2-20130417/19615_1 /TAXON_ID=2839 ORGANISM="Odontella Sinensis, Strain Grunow 1884" /NCGR_SAMPLE_ID=MMETSP0160_2 /ASSEMBLY_ACC=CAM_ASM_000250 /LENGTH=45 /DNA_ID= /DNA_START= /DNA_END= /DNA_ORIENTATION=
MTVSPQPSRANSTYFLASIHWECLRLKEAMKPGGQNYKNKKTMTA